MSARNVYQIEDGDGPVFAVAYSYAGAVEMWRDDQELVGDDRVHEPNHITLLGPALEADHDERQLE